MTIARTLDHIVPAFRATEGGGFVVQRPFPTRLLTDFDPFLLLDEIGPVEYGPGEARGAPAHPHRGFETVTYVLDGRFQHRDSAGHAGSLSPGDVQWMTAGAGVVHSEMPDPAFAASGGRSHGFQLWINLPRRDKLIAPRYQDIPADRIPVAMSPDGRARVKVIAGDVFGVKAAIETRTPILYQHFTLEPGASIAQAVPAGFRVFAYPIAGTGFYGPDRQAVDARHMVIYGNDGDTVTFCADDAPLDLLLIGGMPLNEPIVRCGPFVMNTEEEIRQAVADYQAGRMGRIAS